MCSLSAHPRRPCIYDEVSGARCRCFKDVLDDVSVKRPIAELEFTSPDVVHGRMIQEYVSNVTPNFAASDARDLLRETDLTFVRECITELHAHQLISGEDLERLKAVREQKITSREREVRPAPSFAQMTYNNRGRSSVPK